LKQITRIVIDQYRFLSALDPGKQGLKPFGAPGQWPAPNLSALDPGKQGLKHFMGDKNEVDKEAFSA